MFYFSWKHKHRLAAFWKLFLSRITNEQVGMGVLHEKVNPAKKLNLEQWLIKTENFHTIIWYSPRESQLQGISSINYKEWYLKILQ